VYVICEFWLAGLISVRTLLVNAAGLEHAKGLVAAYKQGKIGEMNDELWKAKKIVDSTLHPGVCYYISGIGLC
jgi:hypothetical protein